jgi:hypothetical protein
MRSKKWALHCGIGGFVAIAFAAGASAAILTVLPVGPTHISEGGEFSFHTRIQPGSGLHLASGSVSYDFDGGQYVSGLHDDQIVIPHVPGIFTSGSTTIRFFDNGNYMPKATGSVVEHNSSHVATSGSPSDEIVVQVSNVAPTVVSATLNGKSGNVTINEGQSVTAQMRATDPGADLIAFRINDINAGIGSSAPGSTRVSASVPLPYFDDGTYSVSFVANDGDGGVTNTSRTVNVQNVAPTLNSARLNGVNGNITVDEGQTVAAYMAVTDPGADPIAFSINGSNAGTGGSTPGSMRTTSQNLVYLDEGLFSVIFQANDGDGGAVSTSRNVTVRNLAPILDFISPDLAVLVGELFNFSASAHDRGIHDLLSYAWDLDNDSLYDDYFSPNGAYSFSSPGSYRLGLRVGDGDGGFAFGSFDVDVVAASTAAAPEFTSWIIWSLLGLSCGTAGCRRRIRES